MGIKICHICKRSLSVERFNLDRRKEVSPGTRQSRCMDCRNEYNKRYKHRQKLYWTRANKKRQGLTIEQFLQLQKQQNGLCAICGLPEIDTNQHGVKGLAIDHNHNTKKVRGLLCAKCNRALGLLNVDNLGILNLQKSIQYLTGVT